MKDNSIESKAIKLQEMVGGSYVMTSREFESEFGQLIGQSRSTNPIFFLVLLNEIKIDRNNKND